MIKLGQVAAAIPGARLVGNAEVEVERATHDHRKVKPFDLFVAIPGQHVDGAAFAGDAIIRGAAAVVADHELPLHPNIPQLIVPNTRAVLGIIASVLLNDPSERMRLIGVTGTDGKTTTTRLIAAMLAAAGRKAGWITTVDLGYDDHIWPNPFGHTTPEASDLQATLNDLAEQGVEDAVVEVSSHALALDRVAGCRFDAAVFTNLAPEHLDFHGTMSAYADAKARLFALLDQPTQKHWSRMGVVNADDPASVTMVVASPAAIVSYAIDTPADVMARSIAFQERSTRFTLVTPLGEERVTTPLIGRYNVYNWLAATAVGLGWGIDLAVIAAAAEATAAPPGRMQRVERGQPFSVVVDFAHTPQALQATLQTLRAFTPGRLLLVFGMAGGRDPANRPAMGGVAAQAADYFVISSDDPIDEDPADIAAQVAAGAFGAGAVEGTNFEIQLDRRSAIRSILERAQSGDTVLLAGKGHETRMLAAGGPEPWNDADMANELLGDLGFQR